MARHIQRLAQLLRDELAAALGPFPTSKLYGVPDLCWVSNSPNSIRSDRKSEGENK